MALTHAQPRQVQSDTPTISTLAGAPFRLGYPFLDPNAVIEDLAGCAPSAAFVERIPISYARRHGLLGLDSDAEHLPIAVRDVDCVESLQIVGRFLRRPVEPLLAPAEQLTAAINAAYQHRSTQTQLLIETLDRRDVLAELQQLESREDLLDVSARAPVIRLVNLILFEAVKSRASDIHVQPVEQALVARLRVDGVLYDQFQIPKSLQDEVVSRIKVLARMNIAEKRLPQDGRASVQVGDRVIDLRIATLPTSFGERVVIRILDKSLRLYSLSELGMDSQTLEKFRQLISVEHGLVLVTGPTGSGKTTTLYAALNELNRHELNVLTLEDPIEYSLEGVSQTQISDRKGMNFASGLRSVLRQDPDVIMVGEIRDRETAVMAIQSALTGHLVFSTLHTNDAASAITRLLDLGIEPYLLASSLIGVVAQRLVRCICSQCAVNTESSTLDLMELGCATAEAEHASPRIGHGCSSCRHTGYSGRNGIFELLAVDDSIRREVQQRGSASQIRSVAIAGGMKTLRQDGMSKVLVGQTTVEEVRRVTMRGAD